MAKSRFSRNKIQSYTMAGKEKGAQRVIERGATYKHTITAEAITLATGAAGTTGTFSLKYSPIMNSTGAKLGAVGDTSVSISAVLDNEVKYKFDLTNAEQYEEMSNGDYAIDYDTGEIRYKKKTAATSITINYIKRTRDTELTLEGDVYVDNVKTFATNISDPTTQTYGLVDASGVVATNIAKISGTATEVNAGNVSDGVQRITIATDDVNLAAINTNIGDIETILGSLKWTGDDLKVIFSNSSITVTATDLDIRDLDSATDSVSAVQSGTWNITNISGTVSLPTGAATETTLNSIKTATELIDDAVYTDEDTFTEDSSKGIAVFGHDEDNTRVKIIKVDSDGRIINACYDEASNTDKVTITNPNNLNYITETLVNGTNIEDDTYYYYVDTTGYKMNGFQIDGDGGSGNITITVEATMQDDGTPASSCTYEDVTLDTYNSSSYTITTAEIFSLNDNAQILSMYKYIRLKIVIDTSDADDADLRIEHKRLY